jgi:hypothetical protein
MRGKSKLTLEQKNQRFKALLGDENILSVNILCEEVFVDKIIFLYLS